MKETTMNEQRAVEAVEVTQADIDLARLCVPAAMIFAEDEEHIAHARGKAAAHIAQAFAARLAAARPVLFEELREPTPAMLDAFVARALQVSVQGEGGWTNYARNQWQTMLNAAIRTAGSKTDG